MDTYTRVNRLVISALSSGSGKTTITCALIRALKNKGLRVGARKCGPDYIDTMFLRTALNVPTGNLDPYFTDGEMLKYLLASQCGGEDITVIEGVMGFYDGLGGVSSSCSTYEAARNTDSPVILIVDGSGISVTMAAMVKGVLDYRKDNNIKGIIINRVSAGFYERLKNVIEKECGIPVFGYLPKNDDFTIGSRHLGLLQPGEVLKINEKLDMMASYLSETVDIDRLLKIAGDAPKLPARTPESLSSVLDSPEAAKVRKLRPGIGIARDEAFSFYYDDNIRLLEELGAQIVYFSPLKDEKIPDDVSGLIFYGGYPENHADTLSENRSFTDSVYKAYKNGMPIIAECGGFMYLCDSLTDEWGNSYKMCGCLPGSSFKTEKLTRFGYIKARALTDGLLGETGTTFKGHEFHYFDCSDNGSDFIACKPLGDLEYKTMFHTDTLSAGFPHIYAYGAPGIYLNYLLKVTGRR